MKKNAWKLVGPLAGVVCPAIMLGQVPDLLNALDTSGPSKGAGGAFAATQTGTHAPYNNPAALGFTDKKLFGFDYGNLPRSFTNVSGVFDSPTMSTNGKIGDKTITHVGFVFPLGKPERNQGNFGFTYTVGGYINDIESGSGLTSGGLTVNNFGQLLKSKTDFLTLAYGKSSSDGTFSWGLGVNYVLQTTQVDRAGEFDDSNGNKVSNVTDPAIDDHGTGWNGVIGVLFNPKNSNASIGLSYRSETSLKGGKDFSGAYSKIPARFLGGITVRTDAVRKSDDYLVYGLQVEYFAKGAASPYFDRSQTQTNVSAGFEYNLSKFGGRIPVRLGYRGVQAGGVGFQSRNSITYGLGYRPNDSKFALDLNFASPQGGGFDLTLGATFQLDK
ncbi:MAG: hypothetical protein JSS72_10310 [Armatimonadetes bacterium]|nr:hypothetical protein [Armatimonadota bacterium]